MNLKSLKRSLFLFPILASLAACSGGVTNNAADTGAKPQGDAQLTADNADQRIADWGKFVGISSDAARNELSQAGLLDQVGKNTALNRDQFTAFAQLTEKVDADFSNGVEILNTVNFNTFKALRPVKRIESKVDLIDKTSLPDIGQRLPETPSEDSSVKAQAEYAKLAAQTNLLRHRLILGAEKLGFQVTPVSMRDLLADPDFKSVRDAFVAQVSEPVLGKKVEQLVEEEIQHLAEPLASVSFKIDGDIVSFYEFAANSPKIIEKIDLDKTLPQTNVDFGFSSSRGKFNVVRAALNLYFGEKLSFSPRSPTDLSKTPAEDTNVLPAAEATDSK